MIKIICVGKIKETFFKDAIIEYIKRINKYTKINIVEVKDYNFNSLVNEKNEINNFINKKDFIVVLDKDGIPCDSIEFSNIIIKNMEYKDICFIIGGSLGLDDEIKKIADLKISFSKLTFPHQLFRVILLEQIYRSFKIENNETYHK